MGKHDQSDNFLGSSGFRNTYDADDLDRIRSFKDLQNSDDTGSRDDSVHDEEMEDDGWWFHPPLNP